MLTKEDKLVLYSINTIHIPKYAQTKASKLLKPVINKILASNDKTNPFNRDNLLKKLAKGADISSGYTIIRWENETDLSDHELVYEKVMKSNPNNFFRNTNLGDYHYKYNHNMSGTTYKSSCSTSISSAVKDLANRDNLLKDIYDLKAITGTTQLYSIKDGKVYFFDAHTYEQLRGDSSFQAMIRLYFQHNIGNIFEINDNLVKLCLVDASSVFKDVEPSYFEGLNLIDPEWSVGFTGTLNQKIKYLKKVLK